ncbi:sirohydrochlorin cobaltochelatase [Neisseria sp. Ec49-e6-T10]|uniref:sirohydrochlorin cobaltochelatase n=1 Tax=Neisseria sp. Ec49-e6-T10 TaxID=3140744 RepID=UPI003EB70309
MKKALLVVSFGTSYPEARIKNIEACEQALAQACPDRDFFRAFTSGMIMKKIAKRDGLIVDNPEEALTRLRDMGYQDIAIQSLHVINGDEFEKIVHQVDAFKNDFERISMGKPLLSSFEDYEALIHALQAQMPDLQENEQVVFMGHGATHHAFAAYACLDHMLIAKNLPIIVGAVESYPELDWVLTRLDQAKASKAHLMPLMIVAGDHAINDMASDDEDSWNSQIRQAGIQTECYLQGLGENPLIRALFAQHLLAAINEEEQV